MAKEPTKNEKEKKERKRFWTTQAVLAVLFFAILLMLAYLFLSVYTRHGKEHELPNLVGMTLEEAKRDSKGLRLRFDVFDSLYVGQQRKGAILDQYPRPGSIIKKGRRVVVTINSYEPKKVQVPYVSGYSLRHAKNRIVGVGLEIGHLRYVDDIATNNVIEERCNDTLVTRTHQPTVYMGTPVDLVVGVNRADPLPIVPNIMGLPYCNARDLLWESGFNLGNVKTSSEVDFTNMMDATVTEQGIFPLSSAQYGSRVDIRITTDEDAIKSSRAAGARKLKKVEEMRSQRTRHLDTIEWIREGRVVRTKVGNTIREYNPSDTLDIHERIIIIDMELSDLTGR